ncbi:MAG: hypothetical protein KJ737_25775 [Proteobacteria bacterium]|nr:hypothetical protein [Pseudomonadota bacterium]
MDYFVDLVNACAARSNKNISEIKKDAGKFLKKTMEARGYADCESAASVFKVTPKCYRNWTKGKIPIDRIPEIAKMLNENYKKFLPGIFQTSYCYPDHKGIIQRYFLYAEHRFTGEVFAIELLTQPIVLEYSNGRYRIIIDRNNVDCAIISNGAKREICDFYVSNHLKNISKIDTAIQGFLTSHRNGGASDKYTLDLMGNTTTPYPMRYASGGVLPIIKRGGDYFIPFFFRDIEPCGWNIPSGASQRNFKDGVLDRHYTLDSELNAPISCIIREYFEETIVASKSELLNGRLDTKKFNLNLIPSDDRLRISEESIQKNKTLRLKYDSLKNCNSGTAFINKIKYIHTDTDIEIIAPEGTHPLTENVLVSFSLMELGIEVVKVITFELGDDDFILDGEIVEEVAGQPELGRTPVAMIPLKELAKHFGDQYDPNRYKTPEHLIPLMITTRVIDQLAKEKVSNEILSGLVQLMNKKFIGKNKEERLTEAMEQAIGKKHTSDLKDKILKCAQINIQPSYEVESLQDVDIFPWDVKKRYNIAKNNRQFVGKEYSRYNTWYDLFSSNFFDENNNPSSDNPSRLFTAATAKILNLFFTKLKQNRIEFNSLYDYIYGSGE